MKLKQVPLWGTNDVYYWVKHVLNMSEYAANFRECYVDGDLLLRITEEALVSLDKPRQKEKQQTNLCTKTKTYGKPVKKDTSAYHFFTGV